MRLNLYLGIIIKPPCFWISIKKSMKTTLYSRINLTFHTLSQMRRFLRYHFKSKFKLVTFFYQNSHSFTHLTRDCVISHNNLLHKSIFHESLHKIVL